MCASLVVLLLSLVTVVVGTNVRRELSTPGERFAKLFSQVHQISAVSADGSSGLSVLACVGIAAGGFLLVVLAYVVYRYMVWVPRTRRKGSTSPTRRSSLSNPESSADDTRQLLKAA